MARYGDIGPYNIGNVKCILHTDNTKEAALRMRGKHSGKRKKYTINSRRKGKLTHEQVLAIRAALGTTRDIAAQYGISQPMVSMIKTRRKYAYLS